MKRTITLLLILLLTAYAPLLIFPKAVYSEQLEGQLDQIKKEKESTRSQIEEAKKEESGYIAQVEEVESRLLESLKELENLNEDLSMSKASIDKISVDLVLLERDLANVEKELEQKNEIFNNRITSIYKIGPQGFFEVIFRAESFIDFISKYKLVNMLAEKDYEILNEIKDKKNNIISIKTNIVSLREEQRENKAEIEKLLSRAESKKNEIETIFDEKKSILSQAIANKEALIAMENQLTNKENEIARTLESYKYGSAPTGKLAWPTNGRLSSGFGYRTLGSGRSRFHSGIDLYAPTGTPIIAADGGQILKTEYHGGYGYCILVYHGGGFATFYAHLSGFAVSPGQMVQRGQVIGYVGTTGYTTGPHLHFEVRVNGTPQNPFNYL